MKVFISWSGERSKAVAEALRYWLPKVIQALDPWMSADDIDKGTRWRSGIATELEQSSVGIICLTRENLDSTWIHFEAGALSKQQQNTYVCTFLFGLGPTDIREPLAQFQATTDKREDVRKLIFTVNRSLNESQLPESELNESFAVWWPKLEERLRSIPISSGGVKEPIREDREILEEILELVRGQGRQLFIPIEADSITGETLSRRTQELLAQEFGLQRELIQKMKFNPDFIRAFRNRIRRIDNSKLEPQEATLKLTQDNLEVRSDEDPNENSNP